MNIFHRFTLASLKKNRVRTLVTLIGIVLSMALLTAVIEGANSGLAYLLRCEIANTGAYHGFWREVVPEDLSRLETADGVKQTAALRRAGYMKTDIVNVPYLQIESVGEGLGDLLAIHVTSGRMPQNANEILLPDAYIRRTEEQIAVGDRITRAVGDRTLNGQPVPAARAQEEGEELTGTVERTYTVVGFFEKLGSDIEGYESPSYIALTAGEASGAATVFFTLKHPSGFYSVMEKLKQSGIGYDWVAHSDLLTFSGSFRNGNLSQLMYGLVAVLVVLIAFGSISLIYNSFSISVSERTRQFGILKSVGATKKQIRGAVLYEALVLCGIAIPIGAAVGCAGIGITLYCLRNSFTYIVALDNTGIQMQLSVSFVGLAAAALLCLLIVLISAWVPARRALSISPITAIRQSQDVKISGREVRTSRLTKKLFGFEGMMASKNFKRNRKRYRSTVVSLFLSVTLFISAAAFCSYLTGSVKSITSNTAKNDIVYYVQRMSGSPDGILELLERVDGVQRSSYICTSYASLRVPTDALTAGYRSAYADSQDEVDGYRIISIPVYAVSDAEFLRFARENGINGEQYLTMETPRALLFNSGARYALQDPGSSTNAKWVRYTMFEAKAAHGSYESGSVRSSIGEDLFAEETEDGRYLYLSPADMDAYRQADTKEAQAEILLRAKVYDRTEAVQIVTCSLGETVQNALFGLTEDQPYLIYPYSRFAEVTGVENPALDGVAFCFEAPNHAQVYEKMQAALVQGGYDASQLFDNAAEMEAMRSAVTVVNVFSYGFIILISLIAIANVFNTISTNIALRRREFAMLKSVGLTSRGLRKILNYECLIYGVKGLALGLPVSFLMTLVIWLVVGQAVEQPFTVPWAAVAIAVGSVFAVVFATMLYAMSKIRRDNPIDALKNENL